MKRKAFSIFILFFLLLAGVGYYNHRYKRYGYPFLRTSSGLVYKALTTGNGRKAQVGEWVQLHLTLKIRSTPPAKKEGSASGRRQETERLLVRCPEGEEPYWLEIEPEGRARIDPRIAEMIGMVEEKQRMVFTCSPQDYLGADRADRLEVMLKNMGLKADDLFVADIKIEKIMTKTEREQFVERQRIEQLETDKQLIAAYLAEHGIAASDTASGLCYVRDAAAPGSGTPIVKGQSVAVHYTGSLLDGTVFDTSLEEVAKKHGLYDPRRPYQPFEFKVGYNSVIPGWEEGLLLLKNKEKARFFIPSGLAYGNQRVGPRIPANAVLVFDLQIVDVHD